MEGGTWIISDFVVEPMSDFDQLPFVAQPMLRQSWSQAETTLGGFLKKKEKKMKLNVNLLHSS